MIKALGPIVIGPNGRVSATGGAGNGGEVIGGSSNGGIVRVSSNSAPQLSEPRSN